MNEFDDCEEVDRRVTRLIMQRDRPGARRLLRETAEAAAVKGEFEVASHFANELGSLSAADNLDDEALTAYAWAEELRPTDGRLKITTANFLLLSRGEPAKAIQKIDEAIPLIEHDPSTRYALTNAFAIKAVARLHLGDTDYAVAQFREWSNPVRFRRTSSTSCDLRLARALYVNNVVKNEALEYLRSVLAKAESESNEHMVSEVRRVLSALCAG